VLTILTLPKTYSVVEGQVNEVFLSSHSDGIE